MAAGVRVGDVGITYPGARAIPAIFNLFQVPFRGGEKRGAATSTPARGEIPLYLYRHYATILTLYVYRYIYIYIYQRGTISRGFDTVQSPRTYLSLLSSSIFSSLFGKINLYI